ncbi:MAG: hypothetical protein LBT92_04355 [Rickettsiales bacterium]|nr:hypothetical protein [Rickettsiales bacterium]
MQCAACQPGTFTNVGTEASCTKCPVGYYCPGASNKIPCPGGLTAPPGAASRRECRGYIPAEGYTANKNQCVVNSPAGNTACYSGTLTTVNGNTYTYAVSSNSLGIIDSTWACSSDQASGQPMTKANMAQLTMGTYCWCGYKKASGWSSSWAFAIELNSAPNCAYNCPWYCAYYASMGTVGSAVSW